MSKVIGESIFARASGGESAPDSLTMANGSVWAVWGNGASSTAYPGTGGSSTVVEYSKLGAVEASYTLGGHVDGLKFDPSTGNIWALQNEDANSTLTLIDPATHQVSQKLQWASGYTYGANSSRGFDDVVFSGKTVFVSQTSPNPGDPVISEVLNGNSPFGKLETQGILRYGDTGTNLVTGQTNQALPISDPDSLKLLPNGDLILTSEADKAYTFIHAPGTANQSESFIKLPSTAGTPDDAVMVTASAGTFYVSAQNANEIIKVNATGLSTKDLYASVGNNLDQIDLKTGKVTVLASNLAGAHGLMFVPTAGSAQGHSSSGNGKAGEGSADKDSDAGKSSHGHHVAAVPKVIGESIFATASGGESAPDSLTMANGSVWAVWGNGASSTAYPGTGGSSTVVEYSKLGAVEASYTLGGHVDGLKFDPSTGNIWALQNEDANSTLTLIDPATHQVSQKLQWASGYTYGANSSRGFDDVVFSGKTVFVSQTSPNPGDPVISEVLNGNSPFGKLETQGILRYGDTGTNLVTGQTNQALPISDPDSLKLLPNGDLILTSEADKAYTFIHAPGTANQSESFIKLPSTAGTPDDAVMVTASAGTFYVSAQNANEIIKVNATGLSTKDLYASVGNNLDQIDLKTGKVTVLASNLAGAHGLMFVPTAGS
ncbi:MAG: hypothetical protein HIU92_13270, partial [Proteobacteria bacterium]|nr:hypothetical protein [Pseudomonadota bacterium]